jgi:hypothetical protein
MLRLKERPMPSEKDEQREVQRLAEAKKRLRMLDARVEMQTRGRSQHR